MKQGKQGSGIVDDLEHLIGFGVKPDQRRLLYSKIHALGGLDKKAMTDSGILGDIMGIIGLGVNNKNNRIVKYGNLAQGVPQVKISSGAGFSGTNGARYGGSYMSL
jgi:hypothetical protein